MTLCPSDFLSSGAYKIPQKKSLFSKSAIGILLREKKSEMANPLQERMRARLYTGVYNMDLGELLLHNYKDDEKMTRNVLTHSRNN